MIKEILTALIHLAAPGYSDLSRVEIERPCDELCVRAVKDLTGRDVAPEYSGYRGRWVRPSRPETRVEALRRFATIAIAIESVAQDPPESWRRRWSGDELWRGLATIARQESAFWRSVHEGRIRGRAGEWCLAQIHPVVLPVLGYDGPDLVGTDLAATTRCFRVAAELLGRARRLCASEPGHWFESAIAAYGSGQGCATDPDWVRARVETYRSIDARVARARPLAPDAAVVLGLELRRYEPRVPDWCGSAGCRYVEADIGLRAHPRARIDTP